MVESRASPPGLDGRDARVPPPYSSLESNRRPECHPQIVTGSIVEVDVVADFQPQTHRSDEPFHSAARVYSKFGVAVANRSQSALEAGGGVLGIGCEADKPRLAGHEKANRPRSRLELGTKQAMQNVGLGPGDCPVVR